MVDDSAQGRTKVIQMDGVRITVTASSIEIYARGGDDLILSHAVQHLKQWVRWRNREAEAPETEWKKPI